MDSCICYHGILTLDMWHALFLFSGRIIDWKTRACSVAGSSSPPPSLTLTDLQPYALQLARLLLPLGSVLGVSDYALAVRDEGGSVESKCLQVLQRWLEVTPKPTWEVFYGKLREPGLDMHNLAVKIAQKHCPHVLQ